MFALSTCGCLFRLSSLTGDIESECTGVQRMIPSVRFSGLGLQPTGTDPGGFRVGRGPSGTRHPLVGDNDRLALLRHG